MQLGSGIYAMFFVSTLHPEYLYYHEEVQEKGEEAKNMPDDEGEREKYVEEHRDKIQKLKFRQKKDMINLMTQTVATFIFQAVLCVFILRNTVLEEMKDVTQSVPGLRMAFTRFVTGISMHVVLTGALKMGMAKMKFALNHKWKFMRWRYAFMAGFFQVTITFFVALISYFVIIFAESEIEVVKDFLAL